MTVFIVNYRGTVYGVFSNAESANKFAETKFGTYAVMCLDVLIREMKVQD